MMIPRLLQLLPHRHINIQNVLLKWKRDFSREPGYGSGLLKSLFKVFDGGGAGLKGGGAWPPF